MLLGREGQADHDYLYWEFHERKGRQALRKGEWKLVKYNVLAPGETITELYNLREDPGEQTDLYNEYPGISGELEALMAGARTPSDIFAFIEQQKEQ